MKTLIALVVPLALLQAVGCSPDATSLGTTGEITGQATGLPLGGTGSPGGSSTSTGAAAGASSGGVHGTATTGATTGARSGTTGRSSAGSSTSGTGGTGGVGQGPAVVRVHYPAAGQTVAIRGSGAGLSWTTGQTMSSSGDTFSFSLPNITSTIEWKPLLSDSTWALGPNYHLSPGESLDIYPHFKTTQGQVQTLITSFHSTTLNDDRAIYAYLPPSYNENTDATYPVVYMHDGQNLWAAMPQLAFSSTWNVDTAFDAASNNGVCTANGLAGWGAAPLGGSATTCNGDGDCGTGGDCRTFPEAIVIGIANDANRIYEYTPVADPTEASLGPAGGAAQYLTMIVEELKPQIDGMLRTRPGVASTAMCGSSLGGLVTAYAGVTHADVFGQIAELSPSTWWDSDWLVNEVTTNTGATRPAVIYVDSGAGAADDEADTDQLASAYLALGYVNGVDFRHVIQAGAQHSEIYWAQRFPGAMQLILGTR